MIGPEELLNRYGFLFIILIVFLFAAVQIIPKQLRLRAAKKYAETLGESEKKKFWESFRL